MLFSKNFVTGAAVGSVMQGGSNVVSLDVLANRDDGLLKKLYNSFTKRASIKKSELGTDGIKYLNKLANKFGKAIDKRAGGVDINKLGGDDKKETKQSAVVSNERASKTNDEYADLYKS